MFPDLPTLQEQGFNNADLSFKMMLAAPAGTPPAIVQKIAKDVASVIKDPAFQQSYLYRIGYTIVADTPAEFQQ
jgi:tripartite-type tricarboxylate transporter receptor subunit TctC